MGLTMQSLGAWLKQILAFQWGSQGSALATETGDIILMSNDINKIPKGMRLARSRKKVIENMVFLGSYSCRCNHARTCLFVILNSMMLLPDEREAASACYRASPSSPVKFEEPGGGNSSHAPISHSSISIRQI
ncbi:Cadmium/zinc-transporting ATPase HMA2 [Raphanus sativus]|nr:Cadmium/zinc-transporting ATPase HMA2 [Raphanus sativus]